MAVVIRLLRLPLVAGPVDVRHFFTGLSIPDGGVHIIGGKIGEAFVIFATDEDARRAVSRSGGFIKDSSVELFLSSKAEMQKTIQLKRAGRLGRKRLGSGDSGPGCLVRYGEPVKEKAGAGQGVGFRPNGIEHADLRPRKTRPLKAENPYLFLRGLPYLVNEEDVRVFFAGLCVDGVIFLKQQDGRNNGDAIVKFASCVDASGGLKCHRSFMGSRFIEVMQSSEQQWLEFGGDARAGSQAPGSEERSPSPGLSDRYFRSRSRSESPGRSRSRSRSPPGYYVHLKNLSLSVEKRDIRDFFGDADLSDEQIRLLYRDERRTRYAFVMFKTLKDYDAALALHKAPLLYRPVYVDPVSRRQMLRFLERDARRRPSPAERRGYSGRRQCIYIRNFPFDVSKAEVRRFFAGFALAEEDVCLLRDDAGVGLGEALVRFPSEEQALRAERLNRRRFLGTEVLLRLIPDFQMREFGVRFSPGPGGRRRERERERSWGRDDDDDWFPPCPERYGPPPAAYRPPPGPFRPADLRCSSEDPRGPRDGRFRRPHSHDDCRRSRESSQHSRERSFLPPRADEWRAPRADWRRRAEGDFGRAAEEEEEAAEEAEWGEWARPQDEDYRLLPRHDFRRPRPGPAHLRRPAEHFRPPPAEHARRPRPEDVDLRRPLDQDFRGAQEPGAGRPGEPPASPGPAEPPPPPRARRPPGPPRPEPGRPEPRRHEPPGDAKPGCAGRVTAVRVMNLPFKASANEILDFFHGYRVVPDSVSIRYSEQGLPLGEAVVALASYGEALAAVSDLNDRPVGPRKVRLALL